jgi:hypothetical protein
MTEPPSFEPLSFELLSFEPQGDEPLSTLEGPLDRRDDLDPVSARRLEFSCRGDRVTLELLAPDATGPHPTAVLLPAVDGESLSSLPGLGTWLKAGVAVCSFDLPLFGARRSPKLSDLLTAAIATAARGEPVEANAQLLWSEFVRQSVIELRRSLDVLTEVWGSAPPAVVFAGAGLAASVGAIFCAVDERPRGAVLAGTGGGFGPEALDPVSYVGEIAPRPLLFVSRETRGERPGVPPISREAAEALNAAAGEPKQVEWPSEEPNLLDVSWNFLSSLLEKR